MTVGVSVAQNGMPDAGSIRMIGFEGGTEAAARQAYEAARRAIIRCGANGFTLPPDKYDQWRDIEMVFNPEKHEDQMTLFRTLTPAAARWHWPLAGRARRPAAGARTARCGSRSPTA